MELLTPQNLAFIYNSNIGVLQFFFFLGIHVQVISRASPSTRPVKSLPKAPKWKGPPKFWKKIGIRKKTNWFLIKPQKKKKICTILLTKKQDKNSLF